MLSEPHFLFRPTNVEVPKELPKVSMVNTSLKKLKHHLANLMLVGQRKEPHLQLSRHDSQHINLDPRLLSSTVLICLRTLFKHIHQHLVDELSEVQNVFYQMEQAVEQHRIESKHLKLR
ncbi:hypothetical protein Tco_1104351 [Tanacetum coccineum]